MVVAAVHLSSYVSVQQNKRPVTTYEASVVMLRLFTASHWMSPIFIKPLMHFGQVALTNQPTYVTNVTAHSASLAKLSLFSLAVRVTRPRPTKNCCRAFVLLYREIRCYKSVAKTICTLVQKVVNRLFVLGVLFHEIYFVTLPSRNSRKARSRNL